MEQRPGSTRSPKPRLLVQFANFLAGGGSPGPKLRIPDPFEWSEQLTVPLRVRVVAAIGVIGSVFMITFADYLVWTSPKARYTDGLQGRYFLPLVLLFFVVIQRPGRYPIVPKRITLGIIGCILFAYWTLLERYYLY